MQRLGYCISIIRVALEQEPWNHPPNRPLTNHEMPLYDITILDVRYRSAPALPYAYKILEEKKRKKKLMPSPTMRYRPKSPLPPNGF